MDDAKLYFSSLVSKVDAEEDASLHGEWFLSCRTKKGHLSALDAFGPLWGKKRRVDEIDGSSIIKQTCGSAHGCNVSAIAEAVFVRRFEAYFNV